MKITSFNSMPVLRMAVRGTPPWGVAAAETRRKWADRPPRAWSVRRGGKVERRPPPHHGYTRSSSSFTPSGATLICKKRILG